MMTMISAPCEQITSQLGGMFVCSKLDPYVRIRTPFLYPDGTIIDLFIVQQGDAMALTDLGESMRWLRTQTLAMKKSPKQKLMLQDVCLTHGVELHSGMLTLKIGGPDALADGVMRIGQACIRVADLCFTLRNRAVQSVTDEVEDYFRERRIPFERGAPYTGSSGRSWNIDFLVPSPEQVSLIQVLSTGSRTTARGVVEHVVTAWVDMAPMNDRGHRVRRVSLFDDTSDVWEPADYRLVERVSDDVARWSKPEDLERIVQAAA